jgi:hypothetical protein
MFNQRTSRSAPVKNSSAEQVRGPVKSLPSVPAVQSKENEQEQFSARENAIQQAPDTAGDPEKTINTKDSGKLNSSDKPIQRKVGFEFQAFNSVTYQHNSGQQMNIGGNKVLANGAGFTVEKDHGAGADDEMEIVTTAVDETNAGRGALDAQMLAIQALTGGILAADGNAITTLPGVAWQQGRNLDNFNIHVNGGVHFHPQSTIGIKFDKIAELIELFTAAPSNTAGVQVAAGAGGPVTPKSTLAGRIGWSGQLDQQPFKAAWATAVADARADLSPPGLAPASENAISFASILYGFAAYTQLGVVPNDDGYAKYFMPFMLRLGLLPHYGTLTQADLVALGRISPAVLNSPYLPPAANTESLGPQTIQQILTNLGQGVDIQHMEGIVGHGGSTAGSLGMNSDTDIGPAQTEPARNGAVIELRKLGNDVTPLQLRAFALDVFDLIRLINAPPPVAPVVGGGGAPGGQNNDGCSCGCFLTTACCDFMGLPDDCDELATLRWFRDNYLVKLPHGKELALLYYQVAPTVVKRINRHWNRDEILAYLYKIIITCVGNIKSRNYLAALHIYSVMTRLLTERFYPEFKLKNA